MNYKEEEKIKIELLACQNVMRKIDKEIKSINKKIKEIEEKPFVVVINGEEYNSYNDIMDAYGCGIITENQKDTALRKLDEHELNDDIKVLEREKWYYTDIKQLLKETENRLKGE